jgi:hypothetical protein
MKGISEALVHKADVIFHNLIVSRDQRCVVCGTPHNLYASHFFGKLFGGARWAVRWCLENAVAMCMSCHQKYEDLKGDQPDGRPREFKALMIARLGKDGFEQLCRQAVMIIPKRLAYDQFMEFHVKHLANREIN